MALKPAVDDALEAACGSVQPRPRRTPYRAGRRLDRRPRPLVARRPCRATGNARAGGLRRRAPALHPLHLRHHGQAQGDPAHDRRLPHPGGLHLPKSVFDLKPDTDVFWCTADIGWVTGHSYIVYGPLANRATQVMYEGTPDTPHKGRFWELVEKYRVSIFYTAPTAIRTFMKWGEQIPADFDLSSLRLIGSVGEPINPEAWIWYRRVIGADRDAGRRHVVADRDRRHHDQPAARCHRDQARLGDARPAGHLGRRRRRRGDSRAERWGRLPRPHRALAVDAARHLGRPRSATSTRTGPASRAGTSPATARRRTRTATSGCWDASTT